MRFLQGKLELSLVELLFAFRSRLPELGAVNVLDSEVERWVHAWLRHVPLLLCRSGQGQTQRELQDNVASDPANHELLSDGLHDVVLPCQRFMGFSMNGKFASGAAEQEEAGCRKDDDPLESKICGRPQ